MSSSLPDTVQTQNGYEESQQSHSHPEVESSEAEPPPYNELEASSSAQSEMDPQLPTGHAQQPTERRPSIVSAPSMTVIVEGSPYNQHHTAH